MSEERTVKQISFESTEASKLLMPTTQQVLEDFAFRQADEYLAAGQTVREATSIVANFLLQTAWIVAASGALSGGAEPDKDKFRGCVENHLDTIQFKERDA